eukprot:CAMPEP_0178732630 /NCGR_PEP_ID=MMETSP0744-20121128/367_1 /TAXON_ID=913974 /ORGANISM="Nitzschia punctata, Strain CCMP561" /LENGTH=439 /DNA_ID=CAMNT_0020384765 /DNA_START=332 /DNA_END=1652 /DNA_ORIENTATION=+
MEGIFKRFTSHLSIARRRGRGLAITSGQDDDDSWIPFEPPIVTINSEVDSIDESQQADEQEESEELGLLFCLAKSWAWPAVSHRCETHPWEANATNKEGDSALHFAVFGKAPLDPVKSLLKVCPELVMVKNSHGQLPLHLACCYRSSSEVLEALVEVSPETDDGMGFYPLHLLCDRGCRPASLQVLLQYPQGAKTVTKKDRVFGRTPLYVLNQRKNLGSFSCRVEELRALRQRERDSINYGHWSEEDTMELRKKIESAQQMEFWRKARLLILTEYEYRNDSSRKKYCTDNARGTIEACLGIPECPPSLIEYAILAYSEELLEPDGNGELLLHQVCANARERTENQWLVLEVLTAQPEAAKIPDGRGRLALEIFLGSFRTPPAWSEVLKRLILANPVALDALHIDSRLYPEILVERIGCNRETRSEIFDILRSMPSLFAN